jgi:hypothetical protein
MGGIRQEAFFQAVAGEWKGSGSLTNAEGEETPITESWKGEFRADDTFVIEGTRKWGDEDQEFRWVYSFNPTSELYECLYWHTGIEEPIRFEVSLTQERVEMRTPFGDPGGELLVSNEKSEKGLAGEVKMTGSDGRVLLGGKLEHLKAE